MGKILALNGAIYGKFDSQAQLADQLNWPRQRLNKIVNGDKEPDLDEVKALADKLGMSFEDMANIFLASSHQMGNGGDHEN